MTEREAMSRLRIEIGSLADQIDRLADLALGSTLHSIRNTSGQWWLHDMPLADLEAVRDALLRRRDVFEADR